jgi:hypothetical protein
VKHLRADPTRKEVQTHLHGLVLKVLTFSRDFLKTLAMDNFLPLLDLMEKDMKISASKHVLNALARWASVFCFMDLGLHRAQL